MRTLLGRSGQIARDARSETRKTEAVYVRIRRKKCNQPLERVVREGLRVAVRRREAGELVVARVPGVGHRVRVRRAAQDAIDARDAIELVVIDVDCAGIGDDRVNETTVCVGECLVAVSIVTVVDRPQQCSRDLGATARQDQGAGMVPGDSHIRK